MRQTLNLFSPLGDSAGGARELHGALSSAPITIGVRDIAGKQFVIQVPLIVKSWFTCVQQKSGETYFTSCANLVEL